MSRRCKLLRSGDCFVARRTYVIAAPFGRPSHSQAVIHRATPSESEYWLNKFVRYRWDGRLNRISTTSKPHCIFRRQSSLKSSVRLRAISQSAGQRSVESLAWTAIEWIGWVAIWVNASQNWITSFQLAKRTQFHSFHVCPCAQRTRAKK